MRKNSNSKILPLWRTSKCKQTERFSVMPKGTDCFLPLDVISKQRFKVKINKIQRSDPYQLKKEELSGDTIKFPPLR